MNPILERKFTNIVTITRHCKTMSVAASSSSAAQAVLERDMITICVQRMGGQDHHLTIPEDATARYVFLQLHEIDNSICPDLCVMTRMPINSYDYADSTEVFPFFHLHDLVEEERLEPFNDGETLHLLQEPYEMNPENIRVVISQDDEAYLKIGASYMPAYLMKLKCFYDAPDYYMDYESDQWSACVFSTSFYAIGQSGDQRLFAPHSALTIRTKQVWRRRWMSKPILMNGRRVLKLDDDSVSSPIYNFRDLITINNRLPLNMEPEPFVDAICAAWEHGDIDLVGGHGYDDHEDNYDGYYEDDLEDNCEDDYCDPGCGTGRFCSRCGE